MGDLNVLRGRSLGLGLLAWTFSWKVTLFAGMNLGLGVGSSDFASLDFSGSTESAAFASFFFFSCSALFSLMNL